MDTDTEHDVHYADAAHALAEQLHAGQQRRSGSPYIQHPVLVRDLVCFFGADSRQQAVALLHDGVEDSKEAASGLHLYDLLMGQLEERVQPAKADDLRRMHQWALEVCYGVQELTNHVVRYEGKRTWQVAHSEEISDANRPIKISDQAATVIEFLREGDIHDIAGLKREKAFALKGLDVARACDGGRNGRHYQLYARAFKQLREVCEYGYAGRAQEAEECARRFDWKTQAAQIQVGRIRIRAPLKPEEVQHLYLPESIQQAIGVTRITLSAASGRVVGFGVIVSPMKEDGSANATAEALRDAVEAYRRAEVSTHGLQESGTALHARGLEQRKTIYTRDFKLRPPLSLPKFLEIAADVAAVTNDATRYFLDQQQLHMRERSRA